jgi:hypothetical protein
MKNESKARKIAAIKHSARRARQRYGIFCTDEDIYRASRLIRQGKATFILRQSCSRSLWEVNIHGFLLPVIYHSYIHAICTVLPRGWEVAIAEYCDRAEDEWRFE